MDLRPSFIKVLVYCYNKRPKSLKNRIKKASKYNRNFELGLLVNLVALHVKNQTEDLKIVQYSQIYETLNYLTCGSKNSAWNL